MKGSDNLNVGSTIRAIRELQGIPLEEVGNSLGNPKHFDIIFEDGDDYNDWTRTPRGSW